MQTAERERATRQGNIQLFLFKRVFQSRFPHLCGPRAESRFEGFFHLVGALTDRRAFLLRKPAQSAEDLHQRRTAPQVGDAPGFQRGLVRHGAQGFERGLFNLIKLIEHITSVKRTE